MTLQPVIITPPMVGSYHPDLGDKAEDEMIERGDLAGALLFRTLDEMRDSAPFRQRGIPFLVVNRLLPETSLNYVGADHLKWFHCGSHLLQSFTGESACSWAAPNTSATSIPEGLSRRHTAAGVDADPGGYESNSTWMADTPHPKADGRAKRPRP